MERALRRMRKKRRNNPVNKKQIIISLVICLAVALFAAVFIHMEQTKQKSMQITAGNTHNVGNSYRNIVYKGQEYQYNNRITNILYAGVDSTGKLEASSQYGNKARADSIALVVMDEKNRRMTILSINRDTMTDIRRYTMNGNDKGLYTTHIGYAYSYGDGGKVSCESLCEAVSLLLGDIPVKRYVVTNQDSMPYINELAGGITLTVPNNDLQEKYPEMAEGAQVTLDDSNIKDFLQYRNTEESFSNEGRMQRQKAYLTAYVEKMQSMDENDLEKAWDSLDVMDDYIQTSVTRNQYLGLVKTLKKAEFTEDSIEQLPGTDQEGDLHDEFHVDEDALRELIIRLFYENIRKTSLDEFPQFWNVLNGTMSLVGTRPILQDELQKYELHHRARIAIKPGITGMWQVSGRSDITDFEEVVRLDTEYISNWNFGLDIKILFKTVMTVLKREGSV